jgi:hypothetical protein
MYTKGQKLAIKQDIKKMVIAQKENKRNRKTDHLQGERTIKADQAMSRHAVLRKALHHHYIAYAIMRGKSPEWITEHVDRDYSNSNTNYINSILEKYGKVICFG